jgi:hypothetical protein
MEPRVQLSDEALTVLREVREGYMDGYTVMSKTRLGEQNLETAVRELIKQRLLEAKGDLYPKAIGEAILYVPPDAKGYADFILGKLSSSYS